MLCIVFCVVLGKGQLDGADDARRMDYQRRSFERRDTRRLYCGRVAVLSGIMGAQERNRSRRFGAEGYWVMADGKLQFGRVVTAWRSCRFVPSSDEMEAINEVPAPQRPTPRRQRDDVLLAFCRVPRGAARARTISCTRLGRKLINPTLVPRLPPCPASVMLLMSFASSCLLVSILH